jgi:hypothetical protein
LEDESSTEEEDDVRGSNENWMSRSPLVWLNDKVTPVANEGYFLTLMRRHRNLLCCLAFNGAILFHVIEQAIPPFKPDFYNVLNNLVSMCFFVLMSLFIHCKMDLERRSYSEG